MDGDEVHCDSSKNVKADGMSCAAGIAVIVTQYNGTLHTPVGKNPCVLSCHRLSVDGLQDPTTTTQADK
jgi:hypothetical protein